MTMKKQLLPTCFLLATLWLLVTATLCAAADASFSWIPNSISDLVAGYKIHYGTSTGNYDKHVVIPHPPTESDGRVHYTITGLTGGTTYYFAATAYNIEGYESDYSTEVVWTAPADGGGGGTAPADGVTNNTTPTAAMTASPTSGTAALEVLFDGSASTDPDNDQLTYIWDFGDGATATTATPSISHTYTAAGDYTATLQVDDGTATSPEASLYLTVNLPTSGGLDTSSPTAEIGLDKATGTAPLTISFNGTGSTPSTTNGSIRQYAWSFGDGTSASGATTQHIYTSPGTYQVTLTVTDDSNAQNHATVTITVTSADNSGTTTLPPPITGSGTTDKQTIMVTLQQVYMLLLK